MKRLLRCCYLGLVLIASACESENEHFCARYQYVYDQLQAEDLPNYSEMKERLLADMDDSKKKREQAKFMLFVLEDWRSGLRQEQESSRDLCMRIKRWQHYR